MRRHLIGPYLFVSLFYNVIKSYSLSDDSNKILTVVLEIYFYMYTLYTTISVF